MRASGPPHTTPASNGGGARERPPETVAFLFTVEPPALDTAPPLGRRSGTGAPSARRPGTLRMCSVHARSREHLHPLSRDRGQEIRETSYKGIPSIFLKPLHPTFREKPSTDAHFAAIDGPLVDMPIMAYTRLPYAMCSIRTE